MKSTKSKQMIRRFLKENPEPSSNLAIWYMQKSKDIRYDLDLNVANIIIYPKTRWLLLKTFLREVIKIENSDNFKYFMLDDEGDKTRKETSEALFMSILKDNDRPMSMYDNY